MAIFLGRKIEFGVKDLLPLRGFPPGRTRIRQRNGAAVVVFIRPLDGGIRRFCVVAREGGWWPAFETGANRNASNNPSEGQRMASEHSPVDSRPDADGAPATGESAGENQEEAELPF